MSKTFLEALTSVGKNLQSGVDKLKETKSYVRPEEYGAIGDGTTDDSNAIYQAITTGKDVLFSGKSYAINTSVIINNSTCLKGEKGATLICNAEHSIYTNESGNNKFDIEIHGIKFIAEDGVATIGATTHTGSLIRLFYCSSALVESCSFYDTSGKQMLWFRGDSENIHIKDCYFYKNSPSKLGACLSFWTYQSPRYIQNVTVENCTLYNNSVDEALDFMAGGRIENVIFNNCNFYNIEDTSNSQKFYISIYPSMQDGIARNIKFNHCYFNIKEAGSDNCPMYIRNGVGSGQAGAETVTGEVSGIEFNDTIIESTVQQAFFSVSNQSEIALDVKIRNCKINLAYWLVIYDGSDVTVENSSVECSILGRTYNVSSGGSLNLIGGNLTCTDDYLVRVTKPTGKVYARGCKLYPSGLYAFSTETANYSGVTENAEFEIYDCEVYPSGDVFSLMNCRNESDVKIRNVLIVSDGTVYLINNSTINATTVLNVFNNNILCDTFSKPSGWTNLTINTQISNYANGVQITY